MQQMNLQVLDLTNQKNDRGIQFKSTLYYVQYMYTFIYFILCISNADEI